MRSRPLGVKVTKTPARAGGDLRPRPHGQGRAALSVRVEHDGAVATVTLDRPERLNALDLDHTVALRDSLRVLASDRSVRVVVLTGAGRGFCAGGDVTAMTGEGRSGDAAPLDLRSLMEVSELLHTMPAFTVAAVNGPCAGAGLSFASACDLRYAARSAVFVTAFLRVGSSGDHGSAWVLTRAVGPVKARELLFLGDRIDAEEALRIGLVSGVVADDALLGHVDAGRGAVGGNPADRGAPHEGEPRRRAHVFPRPVPRRGD